MALNMNLEELRDLIVEIPNTCQLAKHAQNVTIGMTQTTPVLFIGFQNLCSPYRRQRSNPTTQAVQLLDDSFPLINHYVSCVRLFLCCDPVYTQNATRGRGHVQKSARVPG